MVMMELSRAKVLCGEGGWWSRRECHFWRLSSELSNVEEKNLEWAALPEERHTNFGQAAAHGDLEKKKKKNASSA